MTVLVSVVKQMIANGAGVRAVACASTGDTSASLAAYAAAAGLPAVVILPRGKVTAAQLVQPLANGAQRARARHRLRRLHGDRQAAGRGGRRLPRELDEQPAHRGAEDAVDRDRPAVRLGGAGSDRHSGRQPRQRQRARRRLRHDARPRPHRQAPAHRRRAGGGGQPALPRVPGTTGQFEPVDRAADARLGDPDRQSGVVRQGGPHAAAATTASSSRRPRTRSPTPRRAPTAPACSTARTPAWRSRRSRSCSRAARSGRPIG